METLGSFPGRRLALSPAGPRVAAVWTDRRSRSLVAAWLSGADGPVEPVPIRLGGSRQVRQPVIQSLSRREVAVAWTEGRRDRSRVQVATGRLDSEGGFRVRSRFRSARGHGEADLSRTADGQLVLASTRQRGEGSEVVLQRLQQGSLRPSGRTVIAGGDPFDAQLASLSAGRGDSRADTAVLVRDNGGITLAVVNTAEGRVLRNQRVSGESSAKGPALASDDDRRLVAAWAQREPGSGENVRLRTVDALSGRMSESHQPHASAAGDQRDPMVALSPRGWIRTAWRNNTATTTGISSGLSRLSSSGQWRRDASFSTPSRQRAEDPDVVVGPGGTAFLGWTAGSRRRPQVVLTAWPDRRFSGSSASEPDNRIVATLRRDRLEGTEGRDVFVFPTRRHSLRDRYDTITGFQAQDVIDDHHARNNVTVDPITSSAGTIRSLRRSELNKVARRRFGYGVFGAVAFEVRGEPGTWLAINDRRDGFQANSDPIIHLSDYRVSQASPITIV